MLRVGYGCFFHETIAQQTKRFLAWMDSFLHGRNICKIIYHVLLIDGNNENNTCIRDPRTVERQSVLPLVQLPVVAPPPIEGIAGGGKQADTLLLLVSPSVAQSGSP
jgi:hypothetical protein